MRGALKPEGVNIGRQQLSDFRRNASLQNYRCRHVSYFMSYSSNGQGGIFIILSNRTARAVAAGVATTLNPHDLARSRIRRIAIPGFRHVPRTGAIPHVWLCCQVRGRRRATSGERPAGRGTSPTGVAWRACTRFCCSTATAHSAPPASTSSRATSGPRHRSPPGSTPTLTLSG